MEFTTSERWTRPVRKFRDSQIDLTSMVDITFLLLVFFMVTAGFIAQQAIAQPQPELAGLAPQSPDPAQVLVVHLDAADRWSWAEDGSPLPTSERGLRRELRAELATHPGLKLRIEAHPDSHHAAVIQLWNLALSVGIEEVDITTR